MIKEITPKNFLIKKNIIGLLSLGSFYFSEFSWIITYLSDLSVATSGKDMPPYSEGLVIGADSYL